MPLSEFKERPILMSAPMVIATLQDRKEQTRRIAKFPSWVDKVEQVGEWFTGEGIHPAGECDHAKCSHIGGIAGDGGPSMFTLKCPYGKVGDRLWVRENYRFERFFELMGIDDYAAIVRYPADEATREIYQCDAPENVGFWPGAAIRKFEGKLRPGIFMYRWASRIALEITDIRVERVQSISTADVTSEGTPGMVCGRYQCERCNGRGRNVTWPSGCPHCDGTGENPINYYRILWDSLRSNLKPEEFWHNNPWVFVISFRRI